MSDLLTLLLEQRSITEGTMHVGDVQIKFADLDAWRELKKYNLIEAEPYEFRIREDFQANFAHAFAVAMVEATGSHIFIQLLVGPADRARSHRLLTHGTVVARGKAGTSAFISALIKHAVSPREFWNFATDANIESTKRIEEPDFFVIGDFDIAETSTERQIVDRAKQLIGNRDKAEAWFKYQPLPSFENKTPRQLVEEGRSDAVLLHLDTLEDGIYA
jgi:hypothetical protein